MTPVAPLQHRAGAGPNKSSSSQLNLLYLIECKGSKPGIYNPDLIYIVYILHMFIISLFRSSFFVVLSSLGADFKNNPTTKQLYKSI